MKTIFESGFKIKNGMTKRRKNFMNEWEQVEIGSRLEEYKELQEFIIKNKISISRLPIETKKRIEHFVLKHLIFYSEEFKNKEEQINMLFTEGDKFPQIIEMFSRERYSERLTINGKNPMKTSLHYERGTYCLRQIDEIRNLKTLLEYYVIISDRNYKESVI